MPRKKLMAELADVGEAAIAAFISAEKQLFLQRIAAVKEGKNRQNGSFLAER